MYRIRAALVATAMLAVTACRDKPVQPVLPPAATAPPAAPVTTPVNVETAPFAPALQIDLKASTRTPSGLYYRDIKVGDGPVATAGKQVSVNYTGWLSDGTEFEKSPAPISFDLGTRAVIAGWDEGIAGMRVGGKRQLIIAPELGYGPAGSPPKIPANAIMVFNVELVAVK